MALPPEKPRQQAKARPEPASPPEATRTVSAPTPVQGSTPVDTGVRGPGFGLSSAGGTANNNAKVELDTTDFCCGEYLNAMSAAITRNWNQRQGARGTTTMKFTIRKDGSLTGIEVERTSGFVLLDREAERALNRTTLPPLPDRYTNPTLTVHIQFKYEP
jgi:TonB family protein